MAAALAAGAVVVAGVAVLSVPADLAPVRVLAGAAFFAAVLVLALSLSRAAPKGAPDPDTEDAARRWATLIAAAVGALAFLYVASSFRELFGALGETPVLVGRVALVLLALGLLAFAA